MNAPPFDVPQARRWFAVECNNHAWDLLDKPQRTADETERLVHAAHAACFHWLDAGDALNHLRARQLLGVVYAEVERPVEAVRHAAAALRLARDHAGRLAEFDLPFVYEACARAYASAGDVTRAVEFKRQAEDAALAMSDVENRQICFGSFAARRWFGLSPFVTLVDPESRSLARVHAGFGFNCYDLQVTVADRTLATLWKAEGFEAGTARPSGSGVPLLFPFPGRIAQGRFVWDGRTYEIPPTDNRGNAIHGFVMNRPWRVVERSLSRVAGEFQGSVDAPEVADQWPADYAIRATYELRGGRLTMTYECSNPDQRPLPCGFGTHPYFRVPLGGPSGAACVVSLPVAEEWELTDLLATGVRRPTDVAARLRQGQSFGDLQLDNAFTGVQFDGDEALATIRDPGSGRTLRIGWDRAFRECVAYTPPHREAICVEPLTCVPGAVLLEPRGVDAGLRVLAPGESFRGVVTFELS